MIIVLLLLGIAGYFALQNAGVQTWLTQRLASYLSGQLGTKVEVGSVEVDLWARLVIKDLYIEDQHQDTLAFIPELHLRSYSFDSKAGVLKVSSASLENPYFCIQRHKEDSTLNYAFIIDYIDGLSSGDTTSKATDIFLDDIQINNARFTYLNGHRPPRGVFGIDWNHLYLDGVNLNMSDFSSVGDSINANIKQIAARDVSGFMIKEFQSQLEIVGGLIKLNDSFIETNDSQLKGDLSFNFESEEDIDFFETKVEMNHEFKDAEIQMGDLSYFVSDLEGMKKKIILSGKIRGTVAELKGKKVEIQFDDNSYFKGDFDMDGLPYMDQTFINLDIKKLTTNKRELERIPLPPFTENTYLKTPDNFSTLGQMEFSGNFTGFINDFVAYGDLTTAIGQLSSDISFREDTLANDYFYKGNLKTVDFDMGRFYQDNNLGPVSADVAIEGSGLTVDKLDLLFDGEISSVTANGYRFTNIITVGQFKERFFDGEFSIYDPSVEMDFIGQINFREKKPILDFEADIHHLDLKRVHILEKYDYSSVSGEVVVRSEGLDFANFEGEIDISNLTYCAKSKDYYLNRLNLKAERKGDLKISLNSDIARATIEGKFDLAELGASFEEILSEVIPSYQPPIRKHREQNFRLSLDILNFSQVSEVFIPELKIAPNTSIDMVVNEPQSFFETTLVSDEISYQDNVVKGIVLDARRPDSSLYISLISDKLSIGSDLVMDDFAVDTRSDADTVYTAVAWGNTNTVHAGDINGKLTVRGYQNLDFLVGKSNLRVNDQVWNLRENAFVSMDSTEIKISQFAMQSGGQKVELDGSISNLPNEKLNININAFDIANLNPFIGEEPKFYGTVSGTASLRDVYHDLIFTNDIALIDFKLNDYLVGDVCVESLWDNTLRSLRIDGEIEKNKLIPLSFAGFYRLDDKESPIDLVATVKDFDLAFINEFLGEGVLDIQGFTNGTIAITGKPESPQLQGLAFLKDASIYVDYLNARFKIEQQVGIYPDMFTFDHIKIRDEDNNPGYLTGQILHNAFADWNFDIIIDMEENPMMAMNTTQEMNPTYYGKAYTTGYVSIYGYDDQLEFDINLKTAPGTSLSMPMSSSEDVQFGSFIRFIQKDTVQVEQPFDLSGIKLKMDLDITPDAYFQIIFDAAVGDVMSGSGQGHINMEINNLSTFNMYGTVELLKGEYLFTLKNMLSKGFSVRPGGTISWYGDPFAADLNLKAVYKVSASLTDVIPDAISETGQRVPVDLVMNLTGKMFNPGVTFDIELPTVDEVTKSRVQSAISTEQERNRQAFALLVLRRFVSPPNINRESSVGRAFAENSTELLSSQISNWLSQISDDFNLGFNYRPGDDISNEEIALALSTQLFNERLAVSSNVGVSRGTTSNQNPSNLIGDIRLEYKLTPEGKIRLVVYNESNDFRMITTQQSPYTQGVGVLYQEEFDTIDEFYCGFQNLFRKRENQIKCGETQ